MADAGGTMTIIPEGNQEPKTLLHGVDGNDRTMDHTPSLDINAPTIATLRASVPADPHTQSTQPKNFGDYQIVRFLFNGVL